jgi:hypothetical protein
MSKVVFIQWIETLVCDIFKICCHFQITRLQEKNGAKSLSVGKKDDSVGSAICKIYISLNHLFAFG